MPTTSSITGQPIPRSAHPREPHSRPEPAPALADTKQAWDQIAPGYDRTNTTTQMRLGKDALQRAGLQAGMRFLDVASGSGALSIPAARMGAEVVAVDQSVVMLELLRARALQEQLRVETRAMDGHALAVEDDRFDLVGSQFGVMLFPDMPKGIREMVRVARRGGKVLVIAYGNPHEIDFLKFFVGAIRTARPTFEGPPMDPLPRPFQLSDAARLRGELEAASLTEVTVETITESTRFATGGDLWEWIVSSNPIAGEILRGLELSETEQTAVRHKLNDMVRERAGNDGPAVLNNPVHIGIGKKLKHVGDR